MEKEIEELKDTVHVLKTWDEFMIDIATGKKPFEVRKCDRDYNVGDTLLLEGYNPDILQYTGKTIEAEVTYILDGTRFGIKEGYCVMGIKVRNYNF